MTAPVSTLGSLQCARCGASHDPDRLQTLCSCGGTLFARYDLPRARESLTRDAVGRRAPGLWRWAEILPVRDPARRRGLGEGDTPLVPAVNLGRDLGMRRLLLKDEGRNPGGSFKARGMAVAVARAVELGATRFALPSAGNAGGAAAAYGARWGADVRVALPADTPEPFRAEAARHGARVDDVAGDIAGAGRWLAAQPDAAERFFLSTLKEPYRVEGKKTMGLELVEQTGWRWPEVVVYPTGGGTGIVGMAKADAELRALGLIDGPPPCFVVVQAAGCAPLVRAFERGETHAEPWNDPDTAAWGLRVPGTIGDHIILEALRAGGGTAVAVTDGEMNAARIRLGRREGLFVAPEAAATLAAVDRLRASGWLPAERETVLFLTGNGFKYAGGERRP